MKNTLMIAAALLTLGASSSAFAAENFVGRYAATSQASVVRDANNQQQSAFPATNRSTVSVYSQFSGSYTDGGQQ
jgi:hypothetical protein